MKNRTNKNKDKSLDKNKQDISVSKLCVCFKIVKQDMFTDLDS